MLSMVSLFYLHGGSLKLHLYSIFKQNYHILAERPGVARENLKFEKKLQ